MFSGAASAAAIAEHAASPPFCQKAASSALHDFPFSMVDVGRKLLEGTLASLASKGTSSRSYIRRGAVPFQVC